jgi:hypothetical protein
MPTFFDQLGSFETKVDDAIHKIGAQKIIGPRKTF